MNEQISAFICKFMYLIRLDGRVLRHDAVAAYRGTRAGSSGDPADD